MRRQIISHVCFYTGLDHGIVNNMFVLSRIGLDHGVWWFAQLGGVYIGEDSFQSHGIGLPIPNPPWDG